MHRGWKTGWNLKKHVKTGWKAIFARGTKKDKNQTPTRVIETGESSTSSAPASSFHTQDKWHNLFSCSRPYTSSPDHHNEDAEHDNQLEYSTNLPPSTPITTFDQIPEGCVLVTYDASYDDDEKCWYLSACVWRRNGTPFRIRVAKLIKAEDSDFPDSKKSAQGEIAAQGAAVEYFVGEVRLELSADEYVNGVIFQGDNSTAAPQFENCLRNRMSGFENLRLAIELGRSDIFNKDLGCNARYLESRKSLWDAGIKNARSVQVSRNDNRVVDKVGKYVRSAEAIRKGHGLGAENVRVYTDEVITQLCLVDGIEQPIYNFQNDKEGYERVVKNRKAEKEKGRKGWGFPGKR